ncbi:MAG: PhoH-like protein [Gammaproteobacteria bacterium]|nr:PhoH-like protein [Gammaproteobacteria bacterium]
MNHTIEEKVSFIPIDNDRLAKLCGQFDEHLRFIEKRLQVIIAPRSGSFKISGEADSVLKTARILTALYDKTKHHADLTLDDIHLLLGDHLMDTLSYPHGTDEEKFEILNRAGRLSPKSKNQQDYLNAIKNHPIVFGVGPAGTGKTFLAVAMAVDALQKELVQRIILTRPAVEAGERLGYLPGDLAQKVDPYLRPLYDALYEMLGPEQVTRLLAKNHIELAPLAYMRGRTLNNAFIILDEGQNTTREQMKMFLTRIGFGSTAVVTGDITQIDLARAVPSGLIHAIEVLKSVNDVHITHFEANDAVRHPIVQKVIRAYEQYDDDQNV